MSQHSCTMHVAIIETYQRQRSDHESMNMTQEDSYNTVRAGMHHH